MASWFTRKKGPLSKSSKRSMPEGIFIKCGGCGEMLVSTDLEKNFRVCRKCGKHHTLSARGRIELLIDEGSFIEHDAGLSSIDPLKFRDTAKYKERLKNAQKAAGSKEAVICGGGKMNGYEVEICAFEFGFMGGSMGSAVGEKITRGVERAKGKRCPIIIVSCSGGARMQEGAFSLMQMAKTASALAVFGEMGLPYISVLAHPTAGGVTASFAMLGDVILAEPEALICFAGPRVIEQTIKQKLPDGFQCSEFLLEHGFLDRIVKRDELKKTITIFIKHMSGAIPSYNLPKAAV
ncbi:MAG: acetyl-coenzyme A carboxylase carboxyl transferase subunit beta [bacterium]|nr:MAG: acetyl-coenzyme A carboxylase carboxyl transferase subunit beta [bacterium]